MSRLPSYSMGTRRPFTTDGTNKPGPGAHYPENVCSFDISIINTLMVAECMFVYLKGGDRNLIVKSEV